MTDQLKRNPHVVRQLPARTCLPWRPGSGWNSAWRDLRPHEDTVLGCNAYLLIDELCGEGLPAITLRVLIWPEASNAQNSIARFQRTAKRSAF